MEQNSENEESVAHEEIENEASLKRDTKKSHKKGIIYLSSIPPYMNVTKIREIFGQYGQLGRVYLQLEDKGDKKSKKKILKKFTEGWVEFDRKSIAKKVASMLNNQQINSSKNSRYYDYIWNIKYLSNFKWVHLCERLAYEKAARRQKIRAEIQLAKKRSNFFTSNLGKKNKNNSDKKIPVQKDNSEKPDTESDKNEDSENREDFLKSLFT